MATKKVILSDEVVVINQARDQCTSWFTDRSLRIDARFFGFLCDGVRPSFQKNPQRPLVRGSLNKAMLLDDQVDTNLDTPMDLLLKNEFFQEKYLQLTAEDIQLENLMDTKEVISMVDQPGIEPEMLLDIDADTVSDTEMDDASTSESLKLGCPVIQNLLDEDDIGEIFS